MYITHIFLWYNKVPAKVVTYNSICKSRVLQCQTWCAKLCLHFWFYSLSRCLVFEFKQVAFLGRKGKLKFLLVRFNSVCGVLNVHTQTWRVKSRFEFAILSQSRYHLEILNHDMTEKVETNLKEDVDDLSFTMILCLIFNILSTVRSRRCYCSSGYDSCGRSRVTDFLVQCGKLQWDFFFKFIISIDILVLNVSKSAG